MGTSVPGDFLIELHGPGTSGRISMEDAVSVLYLGPDRFYRIIDVAPRALTDHALVVFTRVSGHQPAAFAETFDPNDLGPFKLLGAITITDERPTQSR